MPPTDMKSILRHYWTILRYVRPTILASVCTGRKELTFCTWRFAPLIVTRAQHCFYICRETFPAPDLDFARCRGGATRKRCGTFGGMAGVIGK